MVQGNFGKCVGGLNVAVILGNYSRFKYLTVLDSGIKMVA